MAGLGGFATVCFRARVGRSRHCGRTRSRPLAVGKKVRFQAVQWAGFIFSCPKAAGPLRGDPLERRTGRYLAKPVLSKAHPRAQGSDYKQVDDAGDHQSRPRLRVDCLRHYETTHAQSEDLASRHEPVASARDRRVQDYERAPRMEQQAGCYG